MNIDFPFHFDSRRPHGRDDRRRSRPRPDRAAAVHRPRRARQPARLRQRPAAARVRAEQPGARRGRAVPRAGRAAAVARRPDRRRAACRSMPSMPRCRCESTTSCAARGERQTQRFDGREPSDGRTNATPVAHRRRTLVRDARRRRASRPQRHRLPRGRRRRPARRCTVHFVHPLPGQPGGVPPATHSRPRTSPSRAACASPASRSQARRRDRRRPVVTLRDRSRRATSRPTRCGWSPPPRSTTCRRRASIRCCRDGDVLVQGRLPERLRLRDRRRVSARAGCRRRRSTTSPRTTRASGG